MSYNRR